MQNMKRKLVDIPEADLAASLLPENLCLTKRHY